ncbi:nucleic-acid-binding protein from transposon X-element [Trichonephila clavipes]|nr:nucleic-acid-binding protein from transposon X-element [Trichonephila clavipes]
MVDIRPWTSLKKFCVRNSTVTKPITFPQLLRTPRPCRQSCGNSLLFINSGEGISELGPRRHKETHQQCVLFAPDPTAPGDDSASRNAQCLPRHRRPVAVEHFNKSTMPPQCYHSQKFFHHSRFLSRAPTCLKCLGGHLTSESTKSAKASAKCANCSGPHPANISGCPKNPINTKPNKNKPTKNVWQERAAARKENKKQPTPFFAEVVKKGTNNNYLDAKEVMSQMAQMMSQWGQVLSLLQTKL